MLVSLLICFHFASMPAATKKYDIELEAMKLYGDDLSSVLARFRRTPEYLEFLKFHLEELKKERDETAHYLLNIFHKKLMEDIDQMFGVNSTRRGWANFEDAENPVLTERWEMGQFRLADFAPNTQRFMNSLRRQDDQNVTDSAEAVRKLDNYHLLHSVLTVDERNNFRDEGFKLAGELIHSLMKSVGPDDTGVQSTRQPYGALNSTATTTTEHSHQVTRNTTMLTIYANALNSTSTKKPARMARMRQILL